MSAIAFDKSQGRLASMLVKKVFSVYFVVAVLFTMIQIGLHYRETYSQVTQELNAAAHAFEPGITEALWNYQQQLVQSIAHGMVDGRVVLGVRIRDKTGSVQVDEMQGQHTARDLEVTKRLELFHTDRYGNREAIGEMVLYSNHGVVLARVQYGLLLALLISVLKTVGLGIIIIAFANRLIAKPLERLTEQVGAFDVAQSSAVPQITLEQGHRSAELCVLRDAFNDLGDRVIAHRSELAELAATLERRVQDRTTELRDKNAALSAEVAVRKSAEQALTRERDFSLALVRSIPELFVLVDETGRILMSNPNAKRALRMLETSSNSIQDFTSPVDRDAMASLLHDVFSRGEAACEAELGRLDDVLPYYVVAHLVQMDEQRCAILVAIDISERRSAEQKMRKLALYDALTQLPNRLMLHDRLLHAITLSTRQRHHMALLFLDLDGFKAINDTAGHDAGDVVLLEVARRLQQLVRESDTVARYGGDEFVVVLSHVVNKEAAAVVAQKLIDTVFMPIAFGGNLYSVGVSIGISLFPDDGADLNGLLERADASMYRAKSRGKGRYAFSNESLA